MNRVGIFGGTFDPPHLGHLNIAQYAYDKLGLNEFWFMPNGIPAYKLEEHGVSTKEDRMNMLKLLVEGRPWCMISTVEIEREGNTYSSDTLTSLSTEYPDNEYFFIIGSDSYKALGSWHAPNIIMKLATIVVLMRDEDTEESLIEYTEKFIKEYDIRVIFLDNTKYNVSSTLIRNEIRTGGNVDKWVPKNIQKYITDNNLYMNNN